MIEGKGGDVILIIDQRQKDKEILDASISPSEGLKPENHLENPLL